MHAGEERCEPRRDLLDAGMGGDQLTSRRVESFGGGAPVSSRSSTSSARCSVTCAAGGVAVAGRAAATGDPLRPRLGSQRLRISEACLQAVGLGSGGADPDSLGQLCPSLLCRHGCRPRLALQVIDLDAGLDPGFTQPGSSAVASGISPAGYVERPTGPGFGVRGRAPRLPRPASRPSGAVVCVTLGAHSLEMAGQPGWTATAAATTTTA